MKKIDVFAHVLLPNFYQKMLKIEPQLPELFPFIQHPHLQDFELRRKFWDGETKQIISYVNVNPEDYLEPDDAAKLCAFANQEMLEAVDHHSDMFLAGVAMVPMNNQEAACAIVEQVSKSTSIVAIQLFTRALGKSIADPSFRPVFETCARLNVPILLHPVFDERKPDNNIVFSWEYELTQAMLQLVQAGMFKEFPNLKIIVHHAGAMVPFFAERIHHILPAEQALDFKKFYVDTAILGNPKALDLAVDYYGAEHVLFGTDAPLGIAPAGSTEAILQAIDQMDITSEERLSILSGNAERIFF
ncbi:amidohydrolase family protein [Streptococcus massiliensis]|uniref:Aminocarboxymuconate-semialdehyde decarboxylase n=1 Tax=Streptococcus massiliensis TaxID=313439 RepID=A0A380KYF8_9STRE|nr:amidohydrolase family protein [Streptococcus massiliensis]SUN76167.1 aminocarboxymuconate-semialdehyde decarboxylase [Streptococcus massiliensis]